MKKFILKFLKLILELLFKKWVKDTPKWTIWKQLRELLILEFTIATKELIGFRSEFITDTKGLGIMNAAFFEFLPDDGFTRERERGSLVAYETGETRLYGMTHVQDQGNFLLAQQ